MKIKRDTNNSNGQPFQPYFFIVNDEGVVQYRIDKTERAAAANAKFTIYRCSGGDHASGNLTKVTPHGVRGLVSALNVAGWLCDGQSLIFDVYVGHNQPREVRTYNPATERVAIVGTALNSGEHFVSVIDN